ncbi:GNAT family N-acetyltransferase [Paracoccus sp. JM45]|uniref:GNAT family N-acetyltransferase n=1 Tax=Paracoccus sp. JM45 TaxID=2283626 RepID=UPI000E6C91BD|nr:N-acetyltransferase [Paracoccus sp. JM45]RJE80660.1 N-acetyltransferase [Paracoccus sp. JM45]
MYEICPETPADTAEVETLYDLCFAPGRTALSSYRLRDGVPRVGELCLVLRSEGVVTAAIRFWPVRVAGQPVLLLGPIAVHPTAQGEGLGGLLMRDSLTRATRLGFDRVLLVGDAPYYSRFGFQRLEGVIMPPPTNPDRVLGLELRPDAWVDITGEVEREPSAPATTPVYDRDDCVVVEPPKEAGYDIANPSGSSSDL